MLFTIFRVAIVGAVLVGQPVAAEPPADLVLSGALVYTLDEARPWAEAVAVRGEHIVFVGAADDATAYVGEKTEVIRLDGRMVLPGFVDAHNHPLFGGVLKMGVSLEGAATESEAVDRVREYAQAHPGEPIVRGYDWAPALFGVEGPTKESLDRAVSDRPAVLFDSDSHTIWMNSTALARAGVGRKEDLPEGLARFFSWNAQGEPTGIAVEVPAIGHVLAAVGWVDWPRTLIESFDMTLFRAPGLGITTFFDAGVFLPRDDPTTDAFGIVEELEAAARLPVRISGSVIVGPEDDVAEKVREVEWHRRRFGSDLVSFRTLKVFVDGVTSYHTGHTIAAYRDGKPGLHYFEDEALRKVVAGAERAGLSVHLHVDGDAATRQALDAIEAVRDANGGLRSRHTLGHVTFVHPGDLPRFRRLGVLANSTPVWTTNLDGWFQHTERLLPKEMLHWAMPFRSLLRNGATLTFGADLPSSAPRDLAPLHQIQYAVTRRAIDRPDVAYPLALAETMTVEEAIRSYTIAGAVQLGMEEQIGSIETGKRADLVVLGRNLFAEPLDSIHAVPVLLTTMNGRVTYRSAELR